ncbi:hypothetical protein MKW92_010343 [Papaver armeniacum]|nr:hypothetical protein MKW92_010343 [Papaver armeniacum]
MDPVETTKFLELSEKRKLIESESHKNNSKRQKDDLVSILENLENRAYTAEKAFVETHKKLSESRLSRDFVLEDLLGEGADGDVWRCQHRLDRCAYAVKRIRYVGSNKILLSEIQAMSKLHHEGIVRYYTSWTEVDEITPDMNVEVVEFHDVEHKKDEVEDKKDEVEDEEEKKKDEYDDDDDEDDDDDDDDDDEEDDDDEDDDDEEEAINYSKEELSAQREEPAEVIRYFNLREPGDPQLLYCSLFIQMELCDRTLYDAMLRLDDQTGREYFKQIVMAVLYMHQQGVVHKDLASVNIFLDETSKTKIGDFGIARVGSTDLHASSPGQKYYREPKRNSGESIDFKTDIYSLGILFLELISSVKTVQERNQLIEDLREREVLPRDMSDRDKNFITLLTSKEASRRPSAEDIVEMAPWGINWNQ